MTDYADLEKRLRAFASDAEQFPTVAAMDALMREAAAALAALKQRAQRAESKFGKALEALRYWVNNPNSQRAFERAKSAVEHLQPRVLSRDDDKGETNA